MVNSLPLPLKPFQVTFQQRHIKAADFRASEKAVGDGPPAPNHNTWTHSPGEKEALRMCSPCWLVPAFLSVGGGDAASESPGMCVLSVPCPEFLSQTLFRGF